MAAISTEKMYDADDIGVIATIKASLSIIKKTSVNFAEKMAECENELAMNGSSVQRKNENSEENNPIYLRAQANRKELEETKILNG
jgi:dynactin 1